MAFLSISCNTNVPRKQNMLSSNEGNTLNSDNIKLNKDVIQDCTNLTRPLNPSETPSNPESELNRQFRLAFSAEIAGEFDEAILHYRKAAELSNCECDRLHAKAGETAAKEAKDLLAKEGIAIKPTQFFWGRIQQLTQTLPCVEVR